MIPWKLHVTGKLFHSGLAHKVWMIARIDESSKPGINLFLVTMLRLLTLWS